MKRTALLASALALAATGCKDNIASVEIFAICAPPEDAAQCGLSGECDRLLASDRPFVFVTVGGQSNRLEQFIQINNQMPVNETIDANGHVNTNDFIAEEYLFHYRGAPGVADVRHPANFTVPAESAFSPVVPLIPEGAMTQLNSALGAGGARALVIVEMQVRGHLLDGTELETGIYEVAVDVFDSDFTGFGCPTLGEVVTAVCPNDGQTASIACDAP